MECIAALQKKVNQGNSVCSELQQQEQNSLFCGALVRCRASFNVPLFDMKIPSSLTLSFFFPHRWLMVWPLKGNSHHPHFYSVLLDSHNEVSFEVSFGGGGRGNVTLEKKRDQNEASLWTKDKQDLRRFKKDFQLRNDDKGRLVLLGVGTFYMKLGPF